MVPAATPTISDPGPDMTIDCTEEPMFTPPTAVDDCGPAEVREVSDVTSPGECPQEFTRTKTWEAEDACGNVSEQVSQTITVVDDTPPSIFGDPPPAELSCHQSEEFEVGATDNCGVPTLSFVIDADHPDRVVLEDLSDGMYMIRLTGTVTATITFTATDECEMVDVVSVCSSHLHGEAGEFCLELGVCPDYNWIEPRGVGVRELVCEMNVPVDPATVSPASVHVVCVNNVCEGTIGTSLGDGVYCCDAELVITFDPALPDQDCFTVSPSGMTSTAGGRSAQSHVHGQNADRRPEPQQRDRGWRRGRSQELHRPAARLRQLHRGPERQRRHRGGRQRVHQELRGPHRARLPVGLRL